MSVPIPCHIQRQTQSHLLILSPFLAQKRAAWAVRGKPDGRLDFHPTPTPSGLPFPKSGSQSPTERKRPCKIDCNRTAAPASPSLQKALHPQLLGSPRLKRRGNDSTGCQGLRGDPRRKDNQRRHVTTQKPERSWVRPRGQCPDKEHRKGKPRFTHLHALKCHK